tara:strand:- start:2845 stop:3315 length:471 start_codon:yes stop_codon:yes gene_type:complete
MIKLAAVVDDLGPSQKCFYLIKEFNKAAMSKDVSISTFYNRPATPVTRPHFSCRSVAFLSGYHGAAIATSLTCAETLLRSHNRSDKYLYLWDIDWLVTPVNFSVACDILRDDRLKLIARSESHARVIGDFCNKEVSGIVDNWNIDELQGIIAKEQK